MIENIMTLISLSHALTGYWMAKTCSCKYII